ncbi:hypothetical protein [Allorhodopirellula solitaria]|uniref:Integral membrane protein n=1 Tax=Allorhodopirellula solitaria TaxID=2527987 RepID=A0A5C5YC29_9BACT|nr:hypothetical protein [Allorhodopirellula solitaria]TWT73266.1 hypothetical protein CA85_17340 [Allorhodopirellula solitaria]
MIRSVRVLLVVMHLSVPALLTAQSPSEELVHDVVSLTSNTELAESSGLAFSTRDPHCIWTHNDSGHAATLFAFDSRTGLQTGECHLAGVNAIDWESLTSAGLGRRELIVADSGDNDARREFITLYRFDEPDPHETTRLSPSDYGQLHVRYPGGAIDCEAVWYDEVESSLILLGKGRLPFAGVYRISDQHWQQSKAQASPMDRRESEVRPDVVTAKRIATLALPMATGADRDPATGDIWITSYFQAFCFRRGDYTSLTTQLASIPTAVDMPRWRQIEALAVDADSQVWITSEGHPAKLGRLPMFSDSAASE